MKKLKNYSISLIICILSILIMTLIITVFSYFNIMSHEVISIFKILFPIISILVGGIILGKNSDKKGWLEGLKLSIIFLIIMLLFNYLGLNNKLEFKNILYYLILIISCIVGSMVGINKKKIPSN